MLKFQPLVTTGAALCLVLPAVTLDGGGDLSSLAAALRRTEHALEVLRGLESGPPRPDAGALIRSLTEAPYADGRTRDGDLERMRNEVALLQVELDALDSRAGGPTPPPAARPAPMDRGGPGDATAALGAAEPVSTGLSAAQRNALFGAAGPEAAERHASDPAAAKRAEPRAATSSEGPDYSADPLRHAQALYRAGRFQEGFALISTATEPSAVCLQARFLEKLGRVDEAIAALESAVDALPDGFDATRAQSDLEFFRWKRDFLKRLPAASPAAEDRP